MIKMPVLSKIRIKNNLDRTIKIVSKKEGFDSHEEIVKPNEVSDSFYLWEDDNDIILEIQNVKHLVIK